MPKTMPIIGRKELIELPDLDLGKLEAKVDTGAFRSSMHCQSSEVMRSEGKRVLVVQFQVGRKRLNRVFDKYRVTRVRSSNGAIEDRYVIQTRIRIGKRVIKASFTLSDRSEMKHPILLGRKFLSDKFLVDVSRTHVTG